MTLLLGVDGGYTKTIASVCAPDGRVLGAGAAGCGSVEAPAGAAGATREITRAIERALLAAGATADALAASCFGLAGADSVRDHAFIRRALTRHGVPGATGGRPFQVVNDGVVALRGGARRDWGVVSSAGTGTVVIGRGPDGRVVQAGGVGDVFGGMGGGAALGRLAIRAVMMAEQRAAPPTALRAAVSAHTGTDDLLGLLQRHRHAWMARGASLAPAVFAAATAGDGVAQEILLTVGRELGRMAAGAVATLGLKERDVEVVLAGGTYRGGNPLMEDRVRLEVHRVAPRARVHHALMEPVAGGLLMAREASGAPAGDTFRTLLRRTLPTALRAAAPGWAGSVSRAAADRPAIAPTPRR